MLVSVIMPTYNCAQYICDSIDSVIAQTLHDWELIIVDDCSTDNTEELIRPYLAKYANIHYYTLRKNSGPAVARNMALKYSTGKYIAFLDSDDLWAPQKLEKQIYYMQNIGSVFSCTGYELMDGSGELLHRTCIPPQKTDYQKMLWLANPIGNLTVMYNQEILGKIEVPLINKRNDFALWLKMLKITPFCDGMPDVLATYRSGRSDSVSSNKLKQAKYHWHLYYHLEKLGFLQSIFAMICWVIVKGTGIGLTRKNS